MRGEVHGTAGFDEVMGVMAPDGGHTVPRIMRRGALEHGLGHLALGRAGTRRDLRLHDQSMGVVGQQVGHGASPSLLPASSLRPPDKTFIGTYN